MHPRISLYIPLQSLETSQVFLMMCRLQALTVLVSCSIVLRVSSRKPLATSTSLLARVDIPKTTLRAPHTRHAAAPWLSKTPSAAIGEICLSPFPGDTPEIMGSKLAVWHLEHSLPSNTCALRVQDARVTYFKHSQRITRNLLSRSLSVGDPVHSRAGNHKADLTYSSRSATFCKCVNSNWRLRPRWVIEDYQHLAHAMAYSGAASWSSSFKPYILAAVATEIILPALTQ